MSAENVSPIELDTENEDKKYNIDDYITNLNFDVPDSVIKYNLKKYDYTTVDICEAVRSDIEILDSSEILKIKIDSTEFMGTHVNGATFQFYYKLISTKTDVDDAEFILYKIDVPDKFEIEYVTRDNPEGVLETMIEIVESKCEEYGKSKFLIDQIRKNQNDELIDKYFHFNKYYGSENRIERLFSNRPDAKEIYEEMLRNREQRKLNRINEENTIEEPVATKEKWW